jgi:hypothetical protein
MMRDDRNDDDDETTADHVDPDGKTAHDIDGLPEAHSVGEYADTVSLSVDYAIVKHFSEHLYGSPNKAVEELVANSFDALAGAAYVYVPNKFVNGKIIVWDDGDSMDVDGLKAMWRIARSPKRLEADRVKKKDGRERRLIGKFGIGKLAGYAVGGRISHLCKRKDEYLLVGVDYNKVQEDLRDDDDQPGGTFTTDIRRLTKEQAEAWVFAALPDPKAKAHALFKNDHWTIAVVDRLHEDLSLPAGRLGFVLGNSMPLRPDFKVWVDDKAVKSRLARTGTTNWTMASAQVRKSVDAAWKKAVDDDDVAGELKHGLTYETEPGTKRPAIKLPELGDVSATIALFKESLVREDETKDERSYGFFLMVRGRLVNPADPDLFLAPPSYGTFYRMQIVIYADGLDQDLLADRGRLRDTKRTAELALMQRALYSAARAEIERADDQETDEAALFHVLPTKDRRLYLDPLSALISASGNSPSDFKMAEPNVSREDLGDAVSVAILAPDGSGFHVNVSHPFFQSLRSVVGRGKAGDKAVRAFELVAVSERLLEGHLYDLGLEADKVDEILGWRDALFRQLATRYADQPEEILEEVRRTSYAGKKKFEMALQKLMSLMGFVATRRGASGQEDVLVVAPTGPGAATFIIDAKSGKNAVGNDTAELAQAVGHLKDVDGASVALVVAREFVGVDKGEAAAVIRDCKEISKGEGGNTVSIVDVETLIDAYRLVDQWSYPLEAILPLLEVIEVPAAKRERLAALDAPLDDFDSAKLLERIWEMQQEEAAGDVVAYRTVRQRWYKDELTLDELTQKLAAIAALAGTLVELNADKETVALKQAPAIIAEKVSRGLKAPS